MLLARSVKHVPTGYHPPLGVGLQGGQLLTDLLDVLLLVEEVIGLAVVLVQREGSSLAQGVPEGLGVVLLPCPAEDHDLPLEFQRLLAEDRSDQWHLPREFTVEYLVLGLGIGEDKGGLLDLVDEVEHGDAGAASHEGIVPRLVTAIGLHIGLDVLVIDVGVGLQQFLVEAGLVERLQVHLDGLQPVLYPARDDLGVEDEGEELVYLVTELLEGRWQRADEGVVDEAEVEVGEVAHEGLAAVDYLLDEHLQLPRPCGFLLLEGDLLHLLAQVVGRLLPLLRLLELDLLLLVDPYLVLKPLHVLPGLVEADIELVPKVVEDALGLEVDPRPLLLLYYLLDGGDRLPVLRAKEYGLQSIYSLFQGVAGTSLLLAVLQPTVIDAVPEGGGEVHAVARQEGQALPFGDDNFVETGSVGSGDIEVVGLGVILSLLIVEQGQTQLQQVEVEGCLLYPLVELPVVREEPLDVPQLRDQPRELAVEGDEVRGLDLLEDEVDVLLEVATVDLHSVIIKVITPRQHQQQAIIFMGTPLAPARPPQPNLYDRSPPEYNLLIIYSNQMAAQQSLQAFARIAIVMQVFFAIIYGFHEGYTATVQYSDFNGLLVAIFLVMLLLIGFGLLSVYLKEFSISGLVLNFIMLAFTIQWYFLVKKFWYAINLGDATNMVKLGDNPYNIRLSGLLRVQGSNENADMLYFTLAQAVACAIAMYVIMFPLLGKVGPGEALVICFVGNFAYTLNEVSFWRLAINDNGYGMRIFLFGSTAGLVASWVIGREHTKAHEKYYSQYYFQTFALLGAIFVWILLPWLSVIDQSQVNVTSPTSPDFRQVAPLNIIYALSASASSSFATSIWMRGKISVHDVIFSCFSGAIAYGSSSNVFPNPFPALLIGFLVGVLTTFLNSKLKALNAEGVFDSLGSLFVFFVPSFIGAIYSAILFATSPYGPDNTDATVQMISTRDRWGQGGFQLIGLAITIGIALVCGLLIGLFSKGISKAEHADELFNDHNYIEQDSTAELKQSKEVKVETNN